jgi:hypothetical protein
MITLQGFFLSKFNMKPFKKKKSKIILNIGAFCIEELYRKNLSYPLHNKKRPYKASISTDVYMFPLSSVEVSDTHRFGNLLMYSRMTKPRHAAFNAVPIFFYFFLA